jgi:hypothetical protein
MSQFSPDMSTMDLLKVANDNHTGAIQLSDDDRCRLVDLLKGRGGDELEYGEEVEFEKVRLVRRVTGAVSIFFEKDEPAKVTKKKAKEEP